MIKYNEQIHFKDDFRDLKAGDYVIFVNNNYFRHAESIAIVEKITPKGFIKVNDTLFKVDGSSRCDSNYCIELATAERVKNIQETNFIKKTINQLQHIERLTYPQAVDIDNLFKQWKQREQID